MSKLLQLNCAVVSGLLARSSPFHFVFRFCLEVHIGHTGHGIRTCTGPKSGFRSATHVWRKGVVEDVVSFPKCFHLYDRVGKPRVVHDERRVVSKIPSVVDLCRQAGLDLDKYPTRRRTKQVYSVEGRIVEFEDVTDSSEAEMDLVSDNYGLVDPPPLKTEAADAVMLDISPDSVFETVDGKQLSIRTLEKWFHVVYGVKKMMESYKVWTCGYCPEVQVGPKGHKVRMCKASKNQSRNGFHAWQEATAEDIVGYNYVWHVENPDRPALYNNLKRYYGKAPAVVELCVLAGAPIPDQYRSLMRVDVVRPDHDEVDLVDNQRLPKFKRCPQNMKRIPTSTAISSIPVCSRSGQPLHLQFLQLLGINLDMLLGPLFHRILLTLDPLLYIDFTIKVYFGERKNGESRDDMPFFSIFILGELKPVYILYVYKPD